MKMKIYNKNYLFLGCYIVVLPLFDIYNLNTGINHFFSAMIGVHFIFKSFKKSNGVDKE